MDSKINDIEPIIVDNSINLDEWKKNKVKLSFEKTEEPLNFDFYSDMLKIEKISEKDRLDSLYKMKQNLETRKNERIKREILEIEKDFKYELFVIEKYIRKIESIKYLREEFNLETVKIPEDDD